jgi:hypothetical protein
MSRWAPSVAALAAVAALLAGCGGDSKKSADLNCLAKLDATARAETVIDLYRRGELGTRAHLEKWAGEKIPFLDGRGRIIPYERMNVHQKLRTDAFTLKVTGMNSKVLLAVDDAIARARRDSGSRCT